MMSSVVSSVMMVTISDDIPCLGESVVVVRGLCGVMGAMMLVVTHSVCKYYLKKITKISVFTQVF